MDKKILVFTGLLACGKGTVAKYLVEKYQARTFRFSTMLRDVLTRLYLPDSRENMQTLSRILRENFSQDIMSKVIANDAATTNTDLIVIDGARRLTDVEHLQKLPGFTLVAIEVDVKIRHQRLVARNENPGDADKTFEQFLQDEKAEPEVEIPFLMSRASIKIDNNGILEDLYKQLDNLVK
ncbi:MAG: AAA family ATPase [Patescibacteria group bacterium]